MRQNIISRRISVINLKGGTGKSSLSMNLAHLLALRGYSVVLIDCDMQGNSSSLLPRWEPPTLTHFLRGEAPFPAIIRPARDRLAIIPSDRDLNTAATYIASRRHAYYTLRDAVQRLRCDFVIYDHAPSNSPVTEAALLASSCSNYVRLSHDMPRRLSVRLLYGIESLQFDARIRRAELPVHGADSLVAMILPVLNLLAEVLDSSDVVSETLSR